MLTEAKISAHLQVIHKAKPVYISGMLMVLLSSIDIPDLVQLLPRVEDEDLSMMLETSYVSWKPGRPGTEYPVFAAIFNHIAQHRPRQVALKIFSDAQVMSNAWARLDLPVLDSFLTILPALLPVIIPKWAPYQISSFLSDALTALHKHAKDALQHIGPLITRELRNAGLDSDRMYKDALRSYPDIRKEILALLSPPRPGLWDRVKGAVFEYGTYVWDPMCRRSGDDAVDIKKLRGIAADLNLPGADTMNKRALCAELAKFTVPMSDCDLDAMDPWSMELIKDIPPHRRYKIGSHCFDIESLREAVVRGDTTNPYDRTKIDRAEIEARHNLLSKIYQPGALATIRNSPLLTQEQMRTSALATIWSHLPNPIPIESFLAATDAELEAVITELSTYEAVPLTDNELTQFNLAANKHDFMIRVFQRLLADDDGIVAQGIRVALKRIPVRRRRRERDAEDSDEPARQRQRVGGRYQSRRKTRKSRSRSRSLVRKRMSRSRSRSRVRKRMSRARPLQY